MLTLGRQLKVSEKDGSFRTHEVASLVSHLAIIPEGTPFRIIRTNVIVLEQGVIGVPMDAEIRVHPIHLGFGSGRR